MGNLPITNYVSIAKKNICNSECLLYRGLVLQGYQRALAIDTEKLVISEFNCCLMSVKIILLPIVCSSLIAKLDYVDMSML